MKIVYILKSLKDNGIYTGNTGNLKDRLYRHNQGQSMATKYRRPLKLICYFVFADEQKAYDFERYLKTGSGRSFICKHFR